MRVDRPAGPSDPDRTDALPWSAIGEVDWPLNRYRVGVLRSPGGEDVGTVVRVKSRLPRRSAFRSRCGMLRTMWRDIYEVRDRHDRCVRQIFGPRARDDAAVTVTRFDETRVVEVGPPKRTGLFGSRHPISVGETTIGFLSSSMRHIRNTDGETVASIKLRLGGLFSNEYAIEPPLVDDVWMSVAVVAAICQRRNRS